jgi:NTP pyrophosphatase (non-canonical NTP hydrolase)
LRGDNRGTTEGQQRDNNQSRREIIGNNWNIPFWPIRHDSYTVEEAGEERKGFRVIFSPREDDHSALADAAFQSIQPLLALGLQVAGMGIA